MAALLQEKPCDNFFPLIFCKIEGEPVQYKFIFAQGTFPLPIREQVNFFDIAFWA